LPSAIAHPVLLVIWGALAAAVGEFLLRLSARALREAPVFIDPASSWTGPLSALCIITPCAALAWATARKWARGNERRAVLVVVMFLVSLDVLLLVPRVHPAAVIALAAGIGWQSNALASRWSGIHLAAVRWGVVGLALAAAALGPLVVRRQAQAMPAVSAPDAPNVLLLVLDTVRALQLSAYGYPRATSRTLERMASEGARFDRAVATAPWTLPTHASLFTGRYQRDLSVGWLTPLDSRPRTLAEVFAARGYATGGFVANMRYTSREYGLARGFAAYRDYAVMPSQVVGSSMLGRRAIIAYNALFRKYILVGRKDASQVIDEFMEWRRSTSGRPYFAFLNVFDAHEPYAPDAPYDLLFGAEPPTRAIDPRRVYTPEEVQGLRDAYDGAIAALDAQLARLFDALEHDGSLDRTIVIVTSDHGEEFAEHGHLSHGNGLHFPALHVPLVIRYPRLVPPTIVTESVSLIDVPQTVLDLAGVREDAVGGHSLRPFWTQAGGAFPPRSPALSEVYWAPNQPERYPVSGGNMRSLVSGRLHFIQGPGAREELYDIAADPLEQIDLVGDPRYAAARDSLRAALRLSPMADRAGR
jgi:arylsulfatase A-like enzyme